MKAAALKLLSMRSHSRKELKLKLLDKGFAQDTIRAALDRLREVVSAPGLDASGLPSLTVSGLSGAAREGCRPLVWLLAAGPLACLP